MIMNCQSHARSLWPPDFRSILYSLPLCLQKRAGPKISCPSQQECILAGYAHHSNAIQ